MTNDLQLATQFPELEFWTLESTDVPDWGEITEIDDELFAEYRPLPWYENYSTVLRLSTCVNVLALCFILMGWIAYCDKRPAPIHETDVDSIYSGEIDGEICLTIGSQEYRFAPNVALAVGFDLAEGALEAQRRQK